MLLTRGDETERPVEKESLVDAFDEVIEEKGISKKTEVTNLNDLGRKALDKAGASLNASAYALADLLNSNDDDLKFKAAKFILERHSGRLDNTKEDSDSKVIINIVGGQQVIQAGQPSMFNPYPADIEGK